jgi:hypothetical protein
MIDRLKLILPADALDNCPDIVLTNKVSDDGVVCSDWREGTYEGWEIEVHTSGRTVMKGSLHKHWSGTHNGGPFGRYDITQAVRRLAERLQFDPAQVNIEVMEFGVNVLMPGKPLALLRRALLHGTHGLNVNQFGGTGFLVEAVRRQYYFKLYDKGLQLVAVDGSEYPGHVLRIEAKTRAMEWLQSAGVSTLADLCNPAVLERLGVILLRTFEQMLFACPMPLPKGLDKRVAALLKRGADVKYWQGLTPASHTRTKTDYRKAQAQVSDPLLEAATQGLVSTWLELLNQPNPNVATPMLVATQPGVPVPQNEDLSKGSDEGSPLLFSLPATHRPEGEARVGWLAGGSGGMRGARGPQAAEIRRCQTCGRPITTANPRAKFCSRLERPKDYKRCKNADSNPRNNALRARQQREARYMGILPLFATT